MADFVGKDVSIKLKRDLGIFQGNFGLQMVCKTVSKSAFAMESIRNGH